MPRRVFPPNAPTSSPPSCSPRSKAGCCWPAPAATSRRYAVRLAMQGGLKDVFDGIAYDAATDSYRPTTTRELAPLFKAIFRRAPASNRDDAVLDYLNEDGATIEPTWYIPVLPMVLVNGSDGIGTGWSSAVPNYNPADIVANLRRKLRGEALEPMQPWFRGFKVGRFGSAESVVLTPACAQGLIEANGTDRFTTYGIAEQTDDETVVIYELPIRSWTNTYVEQLLAWSQGTEKQPALVKVCRL